jgi:hypothetical protein
VPFDLPHEFFFAIELEENALLHKGGMAEYPEEYSGVQFISWGAVS